MILNKSPSPIVLILNKSPYPIVYTLNKTVQSYNLALNDLEAGQYEYEARVLSSGEEHLRRGQFTVMPLQLEQRQKQANHQLLYKLSNIHEGQLFYAREMNTLQQAIQSMDSKTISYSRVQLSELLNQRWIFYLLLVFLSFEWFLRKQNGII